MFVMRDLKTFYIRTYGCQMNELDSEVMIGTLKRRGLTQISDESTADLLIYNTCSIRDLAERKVMGKLGLLGKTSQRNAVIGVTGCMANNKKELIFQKLPYVDFVLGTNNIHELDLVLDEVLVARVCVQMAVLYMSWIMSVRTEMTRLRPLFRSSEAAISSVPIA